MTKKTCTSSRMGVAEETIGKDLNMEAIISGSLGDLSITDVYATALSRLVNMLEDKQAESAEQRAKLINFGKEQKKKIGDAFCSFPYEEPWVGKTVVLNALSDFTERLSVNKKNIELRTTVSLKEFTSKNIDVHGVFEHWDSIINNPKTYGLQDISLEVVIYRVGRYSYYAVEVFELYFPEVK